MLHGVAHQSNQTQLKQIISYELFVLSISPLSMFSFELFVFFKFIDLSNMMLVYVIFAVGFLESYETMCRRNLLAIDVLLWLFKLGLVSC